MCRNGCLSLISQSEQRERSEGEREWGLTFLRSPIEFISDGDHNSSVAAVKMEINQLEVVHALATFLCNRGMEPF